MFWPFAKRGTRVDAVQATALPIKLPADLAVFAKNDACIKLWLPEKLTQALDAMSATHSMSRPDVLRSLLFEHVFGRPALDQLKEWKRNKDAEEAGARHRAAETSVTHEAKLSPPRDLSERAITTQLLGKSVEDFKLWLPAPLKTDLERLAKSETFGLSDYLRKTLVRILLGEKIHHQWRAAIGTLPEEVRRFEEGPSI
jgi:hypothetical protein